jgi:trimethylguanosine synthase
VTAAPEAHGAHPAANGPARSTAPIAQPPSLPPLPPPPPPPLLPPPRPPPGKELAKYYAQRYRLFRRFDEGIQLDSEAWYSVTPEQIAAHQARRIAACLPAPPVIVDAFCGAGGNTVQFAHYAHVIAIDSSPERIALAANNVAVYGVERYVDFLVGDVNDLLPLLSRRGAFVDAVFMAPPWGGPDYLNENDYCVESFAPLVRLARTLSPNVCLMVPRNACRKSIQRWLAPCELEYNYLGNKLKTITLYFGNLMASSLELDGNENLPSGDDAA